MSEIYPEVPADGAIVVRTGCDGGILILAFAPGVAADRGAGMVQSLRKASGLKVIAVADVHAVKAWHPHDVPAGLDHARRQLASATGALRDIKTCYDPGDFGHDIAHSALDGLGGVKPWAPGEAEQLREQLGVIRDRLDSLARGIDLSASASHPSKKSEIERGCAEAVRQIMESIDLGEVPGA